MISNFLKAKVNYLYDQKLLKSLLLTFIQSNQSFMDLIFKANELNLNRMFSSLKIEVYEKRQIYF